MNYGLLGYCQKITVAETGLMTNLDPSAYYGMASDGNAGGAKNDIEPHTPF
jgi:hypothetical protein